MKTLLYIPFSSDENNDDLLLKALKWIERNKIDAKENIPTFLVFEDEQLNLRENKYDFDIKCIYILGHGGSEDFSVIYNEADPKSESRKMMTMKTLAERFMTSFSEISNLDSIKLFFCDETGDNTPKIRAQLFGNSLNEMGSPHPKIYYYNAKISLPLNSTGGSKQALKLLSSENDDANTILTFACGRPRDYREEINASATSLHSSSIFNKKRKFSNDEEYLSPDNNTRVRKQAYRE